MHLYNIKKLEVGRALSFRRKSEKGILTGLLINVIGGGVVLKQYLEFLENGYIAINNKDIEEFYRGDYEDKFQLIIEAEERNLVSSDCSFLLELSDWESIFPIIQERGMICGYETNNEIHIGRIIGLRDGYVELICFKQNFKTEKKPFRLNVSDISAIQFETDYIQIYQKYSI